MRRAKVINLGMIFLSRPTSTKSTFSSKTSSSSSSTTTQDKSKPWKESATLMLVAPRPTKTPTQKSRRHSNNHETINHQQIGSSVKPARKKSELNFLLMTRSAGSPFMGRSICFPGGKLAKIDNCKDWIHLYLKYEGVDLRTLKFLHPEACQPAIYIPSPEDYYSREIIFRITAIRETFEECGILICKPFRNFRKSKSENIELSPEQLRIWQKSIHNDSTDFLTFCEKFECLPDLKRLVEFSNWHAPTIYGKHRFDTMFYMTMLTEVPTTVIDTHEVSSIQWVTARDVLRDFKTEKPLWWLPAPQFYEMFRLRNVLTFHDLLKLLQLRLRYGIEKWLPVYHRTLDGTFEVLPGDDLYPKPEELNLLENTGFIEHNFTLAQMRKQVEMLHRIEFSHINFDTYVVRNIPNRFGHVYDLTVE